MENIYHYTPKLKSEEIELSLFSDGQSAVKVLSTGKILSLDEKETFIFNLIKQNPKPIVDVITAVHDKFNEWTFMGIYKFLYRIYTEGIIENSEEFKTVFNVKDSVSPHAVKKKAKILSLIHGFLHPFLALITYKPLTYFFLIMMIGSLPMYFSSKRLIGTPFLAFNNYFYGILFVLVVFYLLIWLMNLTTASTIKRMGRKPQFTVFKKDYILPIPVFSIQEVEMLDYSKRIVVFLSGYSLISFVWLLFFTLNYLYFNGKVDLSVNIVSLLPAIEMVALGIMVLELSPFWNSTFSRVAETKYKIKNVRDLIGIYLEKRFFKHVANLDIHDQEKKAIFLTFYAFLWTYATLMFISWLLVTNLKYFAMDYFLAADISKIVIVFDILFLLLIAFSLLGGIIYGIIKGIKSSTYRSVVTSISHSQNEKVDDLGTALEKSFFFYNFKNEWESIKQHISLVSYPPGSAIITEGEVGQDFYSLVHGKVEVIKEMPDGTSKLLAVLTEGASFGEIALLEDVPRTASIYSIEPVVLIKMKKEDFLNLIENDGLVKDKILATIRLQQIISEIGFFRDISPAIIQKLWKHFIIEEIPANTLIINEGEIGDKFYIIIEGEVKVLKGKDEVAKLGHGKYFGEIALLKEIPRTATIKSVSSVKLMTINKQDFIEIIMHNINSYIKVEEMVIERL